MERLHLFELEDQPWLPASLRGVVTGSLQWMINTFRVYEPALPLLARALERSGTRRIVDLCSGAGGPWPRLLGLLREHAGPFELTLTDKFPDPGAIGAWAAGFGVHVHPDPVDAAAVPDSLPGLRTLFTGFHHFAPDDAVRVLGDAVRSRSALAIFESTQRAPLNVVLAATA